MSSWTFNIAYKIKSDVLDKMIQRVSNPSKVVEKAGQIAQDKIVQNIVTKNIIDTGNLRDSIGFEPKDENTVIISDNTDYGVYQEFGHHNVAARPFFVPAMDEMGDEVARLFIEWLK